MQNKVLVQSVNPYTQEFLQEYASLSEQELDDKILQAHKAYLAWRLSSFEERKAFLYKVAGLLQERATIYARLISQEMGKPLVQAIAEVKKSASVCIYYADHAEDFLTKKLIPTQASQSYVQYEPQGVVLGVMPWNFPFWQVFRFSAPAIMSGNVCVLKHASNVFGAALAIEQVYKDAGLASGVFTSLLIPSKSVERVLSNAYVCGVVLTGSEAAGRAVASLAGKYLKKSVLELGGSNAMLVMKDCAMEETIDACIKGRFLNTGQSCIAGKRLLVHKDIASVFVSKLVARVEALNAGDPLDSDTFIGVLAREDLAVTLEEQVNKSVAMGAKVLLGGQRHKAFYPPTILSEVSLEMPVCAEEVFGPVLPILTFESIEEAIKISNATHFGLGVSIFTQDTEGIQKYIPEFEEGCVFINDFVSSDPSLPFGGVKQSGYGRELGKDGLMEFVNKKTVVIK